jgi:hypothetical protein
MAHMDREGRGVVNFEAFFFWYETDMKERKARAENDLRMAQFEKEAEARAQRIAEDRVKAALFGLESGLADDKLEGPSLHSVPVGGSTASESGAAATTIEGAAVAGEGAQNPETPSLWTALVHGNVDSEAAAKMMASRLAGKVALGRQQNANTKEVEKVKKKLQKQEQVDVAMKAAEESMSGFRNLSLADKRAFRANKKMEKAQKKSVKNPVIRARVSKLQKCHLCGDRFAGAVEYSYLGAVYCSQYCHASDSMGDF